MKLVDLPLSEMVPLPEHFWHASTLHGQAHVARVMVHATRLVHATGTHDLGPQLWAAVFLHDLARTHDGVCYRHGADAAQRLRTEPALQARLAAAGVAADGYAAIETAVTAHSAPKEVRASTRIGLSSRCSRTPTRSTACAWAIWMRAICATQKACGWCHSRSGCST